MRTGPAFPSSGQQLSFTGTNTINLFHVFVVYSPPTISTAVLVFVVFVLVFALIQHLSNGVYAVNFSFLSLAHTPRRRSSADCLPSTLSNDGGLPGSALVSRPWRTFATVQLLTVSVAKKRARRGEHTFPRDGVNPASLVQYVCCKVALPPASSDSDRLTLSCSLSASNWQVAGDLV